jgi:hypothetical protein
MPRGSIEERTLKRGIVGSLRRSRIHITPAMVSAWMRFKHLEGRCHCEGERCRYCVERRAVEAALRTQFQLEDWQDLAIEDEASGNIYDRAAHARFRALQAAAERVREAESP